MSCLLAALIVSFSSGREEVFPTSYVDAVEVNHVLNDDGEPRISQILYMYVGGPQELVDWTYYGPHTVACLPVAGWALFASNGGRVFAVRVTNPDYWHSVTSVDVEQAVTNDQPLHWRRGLAGDPFGHNYFDEWPRWLRGPRWRDPRLGR